MRTIPQETLWVFSLRHGGKKNGAKMQTKKLLTLVFVMFFTLQAIASDTNTLKQEKKQLAYIVSDIRIPFWDIMSRGIVSQGKDLGYNVTVYSADNLLKNELANTAKAVKSGVDGIIISPISSSSAVTILKFAKKAKVPVVISDIGTDGNEFVSFISSNNTDGAYNIGQVLAKKMQKLGWDKTGTVGIVSIPQKRANGKARTAGFMKAMNESGIKASGLYQQVNFSYQETYDHSMSLIN